MRRVAHAMVVVLFSVAGCAKSDTVEVTGTVTLNGQPAADVEVMFNPTGPGRMASAHTAANGRFKLDNGAVPGEYSVTLAEYYPPGKAPAMPARGGLLPSRFPPKYADPTQSPLQAKIEPGAKNDFPLDVKK
jgi:hypothetical protein